MSQLVAIVYNNIDMAETVFDKLKELQDQYLIELEDMAHVTKDENGKLEVHQAESTEAAGALGGAF